jgi:hypothetical protein
MPMRTRNLIDRRTWLIAMLAILVTFIALIAPSVAQPEKQSGRQGGGGGGGWDFGRRERCFMRKINRARHSHGRRRLDWDKQVGYVARQHARSMGNRGYVFHDPDLGQVITRWRSLGQNSGKGSGCRSLFRAFMRSSKHRSNILGRWRHMGVGVDRAGGTVYVQQVFERRRDPGNIWHRP